MVEQLSEAIARLLGRIGAAEAPERARALEHWASAAGEPLASATTVTGFRRDVLLVRVSHPVAAQELRLRQEQVLARLNGLAGKRLFSKMTITCRREADHNDGRR